MPYRLLYHPAVVREDIPRLGEGVRARIARTIQHRLTTEPQRYGEPLRGTLKGYWRLRVGDYRVVFRIVEQEVWILGVVHRREVYSRVERRLAP